MMTSNDKICGYNLEERFSKNQISETWLATDDSGQKFILKIIQIPDENIEKTQKTIDAITKLTKLTTIFDTDDFEFVKPFHKVVEDKESNTIIFLRDYIQGDCLETIISDEKLFTSLEDKLKFTEKVCRCVEHLHSKNIVHADLKPENIIVDNFKPFIIDIDAVQIYDTAFEKLYEGKTLNDILGTPHYMSPEQCKGGKISRQTDVYALGTILYYFISGEKPFEQFQNHKLLNYKTNNEAPELSNKFPELNISQELNDLVKKALENDLNNRFQTVSQLRVEIERVLRSFNNDSQNLNSENFENPEKSENLEDENIQNVIKPKSKKNMPDKFNIGVVGHQGTGKTILAAGLTVVSKNEFVIQPDDLTENLVRNVKSSIENGNWPSPTSNNVKNLNFTLSTSSNKEIKLSFKEYAGERVGTPSFCRDILGNPDALIFIINPGAKQFQDNLEKNKMFDNFKSIIYYYADLDGKQKTQKPIALVITAADRLKTDLKPFKKEFEKFIKKIKIVLNSKAKNWKRFDVSISGKLKDQTKPKLNPYRIADPFLWAVNSIKKRVFFSKLLFKFGVIGIIIIVASMFLSFRFGFEKFIILPNLKNACSNNISLNEQKIIYDKLDKRILPILFINPEFKVLFDDLLSQIEANEIILKVNNFCLSPDTDPASIITSLKLIETNKFLSADKKVELVKNCKKARIENLIKNVQENIKNFSPPDNNYDSIIIEIEDICNNPYFLEFDNQQQETFKNLLLIKKQNLSIKMYDYQLDCLTKEIEVYTKKKELPPDSDSFVDKISKFTKTNCHNVATFEDDKIKLQVMKKMMFKTYVDSNMEKLIKRSKDWINEPEECKPDNLLGQITNSPRKYLNYSPETKEKYLDILMELHEKLTQAWNDKNKEIYNNLIAKLDSQDVFSQLDTFYKWQQIHSENLFYDDAEKYVDEKIIDPVFENYLLEKICKNPFERNYYVELKELCSKIIKIKAQKQNDEIYKIAKSYSEWYKSFPIKLDLKSLEIKTDWKKGTYIYWVSLDKSIEKDKWENIYQYQHQIADPIDIIMPDSWKKTSVFSYKTVDLFPWEYISLGFTLSFEGWGLNAEAQKHINIYSYNCNKQSEFIEGIVDDKSYGVKIKYKFNGMTFIEWSESLKSL